MDIPALSMAMSQRRVMEAVNVSVMKLALDNVEQTGNIITELIEGSTIDVSV